jgi:hypothetical protein
MFSQFLTRFSGSTMSDVWGLCILELIAVRRMATGSKAKDLPSIRPPAAEGELAAAERHLGMPISPQYRDFLRHANGWDGICGDTLFGTDEFLGKSDSLKIAAECFDAYVEFRDEWVVPTPLDGISARDLLAIGMSNWTGSMSLIGLEGRPCAGLVFHIYNTAITVYDDFLTFFRSYIDSQRELSEL